MSDDAFATYAIEVDKMKIAAQGANNCVDQLNRVFGPLFTRQPDGTWNWRGHYLTGLPDQTPMPTNLIRRGGIGPSKTAIDVSGVLTTLIHLQRFMEAYANALEAAQQAYGKIPQAQRSVITAPPWLGR